MNLNHHPHDDLLMSYAAGAVSEGWSLAVAAHLAVCAECRASIQIAETLGGVLFSDIPGEQMAPDSLDHLLTKIDQPAPEENFVDRSLSDQHMDGNSILPPVLRKYVGGDVDDLPWKYIGPGVQQHMIELADPIARARLLRIKAGKPVPCHGHRGREVTMVLSGSYSDEISRFRAGDVQDVDEETVHRPMVDEEQECICLVVTDAPISFQHWIPRLFQPMMKI